MLWIISFFAETHQATGSIKRNSVYHSALKPVTLRTEASITHLIPCLVCHDLLTCISLQNGFQKEFVKAMILKNQIQITKKF